MTGRERAEAAGSVIFDILLGIIMTVLMFMFPGKWWSLLYVYAIFQLLSMSMYLVFTRNFLYLLLIFVLMFCFPTKWWALYCLLGMIVDLAKGFYLFTCKGEIWRS